MGQIGRYIDSRSAEGKDRIIEALEWSIDSWVASDSCKCLVGHAENMAYSGSHMSSEGWEAGLKVGTMFDRFGVPRISRLFKLRAAKENKMKHCDICLVELPQSTVEDTEPVICSRCESTARAHARLEKEVRESREEVERMEWNIN